MHPSCLKGKISFSSAQYSRGRAARAGVSYGVTSSTRVTEKGCKVDALTDSTPVAVKYEFIIEGTCNPCLKRGGVRITC